MPSSHIFSVNNKGRVFTLSTDQSIWCELQYLGIEFKKVSAHETVVWALGGDHQIYVYVYGASVPIRYCEESYENQRWNPVEGFTSNLLPTDRPKFSSEDGLTDRELVSIHLPTMAWNWEAPWHLHDTFQGQALDKEGWTYAIDFPRTYYSEKKWNSYVRRRKWIRYRRYVALDTWSAVPSIHKDHTEEPFIDIAVGGGEIPGEDSDKLMVWGVTALGKVMVREGVSGSCPEGVRWVQVKTPGDIDVISLSVSRSGYVWAVTWDGVLLVRTQVTRDTPYGISWLSVESPGKCKISQIACGIGSLWAIARDNSVWFRRGVTTSPYTKTLTEEEIIGTNWLNMVGNLIMISIGPNNQVFGITTDDHTIVVRTGVTETELTGRTWRPINLPVIPFDPDNPDGNGNYDSSSPSDTSSSVECSVDVENKNKSSENVNIPSTSSEKDTTVSSYQSPGDTLTIESAMEELCLNWNKSSQDLDDSIESNSNTHSPQKPIQPDSIESDTKTDDLHSLQKPVPPDLVTNDEKKGVMSSDSVDEVTTQSNSLSKRTTHIDDSSPSRTMQIETSVPRRITQIDENSVSSTEEENRSVASSPKTNESLSKLSVGHSRESLNSEWSESRLRHASSGSGESSIRPVGINRENPMYYQNYVLPEESLWLWVNGGGCWISSSDMPKWFVTEVSLQSPDAPWRHEILSKLRRRKEEEMTPYSEYNEAIEGSTWVVSGQCRWFSQGHWVPASLELKMTGSRNSRVQQADLEIHYTLHKVKRKLEIACCSIVYTSLVINPPTKFLIALFTPSNPHLPSTLQFTSEKEAEEWLNHISKACNQYRGILPCPSPYSAWAITAHGDIYVHDRSVTEAEMRAESRAAHHNLDVGNGTTPITYKLERGFNPGCFVSISGKIHEKASRFHINLLTSSGSNCNIPLHVNPRFKEEKVIVLNTRAAGLWGFEERYKLKELKRGVDCEISIVCDDKDLKLSVNDKFIGSFKHRLQPAGITHLEVAGDITVSSVVYDHGASERTLAEWYWRGMGGHMRKVEGGVGGVTWAISHDYHVYIYTGGAGGGLYKNNSNEQGIILQNDTRHMHVWENQRWNPVTGFTNRGLPTDRHTWSDESGRHQRTKESIKLPSRHWHWSSEWSIDFHTPGGVDKDGWQYATDFPLSYHGHRYVTDLVRRRRWVRKCRISSSGPWKQLERVALIDISVSPEPASDNTIPVWGISATGEVVMRIGVTVENPSGTQWELVPAECPFISICSGVMGGIWAVSRDGRAHLRIGVTASNPKGRNWVNVDAPNSPLKQVAVGGGSVWAVDQEGGLYRRLNVKPVFPEGTAWELVTGCIDNISISSDGQLWAVLSQAELDTGQANGIIGRRKGITEEHPNGNDWDYISGTGWSTVCARVPLPL